MERYDPIKLLGEGSFGKVYLMRDKIKKNLVCIKIIKIKNIANKEREAAKAEVELLKRLHHPNIVRYIDSFLSKNHESLCIVMEYCDGGDLASQIKSSFTKRKLFSEDKILHWFVQIALGVHYMHTQNVLHRDLKTQNVFLLGNGRLVLGDLGISKVLEGTMDFAQTCIGTPYYMSPEIFKNKPYSYKSDVWALGCILYEMTTLNHAFDSTSLNGLAQKIIKGKYPPIDSRYSRYLRELIAHMLLPEPKQRPDLDQILRKPFIKKHILSFFHEIISRPTESIGEGTMIFKAAAAGGGNIIGVPILNNHLHSLAGNDRLSHLGNDINMLSLRDQLEALDMTQAILESMIQPISQRVPQDESEAKRLAKEQANALKREKDHRVMVEQALAKLRHERELRANYGRRARPPAASQKSIGNGNGTAASGVGSGLKKEAAPNKPAAMRQPRQGGGVRIYEQNSAAAAAAAAPSVAAAGGGGGGGGGGRGGPNPLHPPPSMQHPYNLAPHHSHHPSGQSNNSHSHQPSSHHSNHGTRGKRHSEARDRMEAEERERERRLKEITEEEMAAKKRREEILSKLGRGDSKVSLPSKEQQDHRFKQPLVSQLSSVQIGDGSPSERKDAMRDFSPEKLQQQHLGGHGNGNGGRRRDKDDMSSSPVSYKQSHASAAVAPAPAPAPAPAVDRKMASGVNDSWSSRHPNGHAHAHSSGQGVSKGNRHDQRRSRASSESEESPNESEVTRRYGDGTGASVGTTVNGSPQQQQQQQQQRTLNRTSSLQKRRSDSDDDDSIDEDEGIPWRRARVHAERAKAREGEGGEGEGEEDEVDEEEEVINEVLHRREKELQAELMLATKRCQELKQTLQVTKSFIESKASQGSMYPLGGSMAQLKKGENLSAADAAVRIIEECHDSEGEGEREGDSESDSDELEEVIEYEDDEDNEIGNSWDEVNQSMASVSSVTSVHSNPPGYSTPLKRQEPSHVIPASEGAKGTAASAGVGRRITSPLAMPRQPSYKNLADSPSPRSKLGDRVMRLKQKCINSLGEELFNQAYSYLKQHAAEVHEKERAKERDRERDREREREREWEREGGAAAGGGGAGEGMTDDDITFTSAEELMKQQKIREILGGQKSHYLPLLDQLLFMEETHSQNTEAAASPSGKLL